MGKGKIVHKSKVKKTDRDVHWLEVNGAPVKTVPLKRSREVALEPISRLRKRSGTQYHRHNERSARVNPETDGISQSGIQIYRLWFRFLKLALELEDLGVDRIVTNQIRRAGQKGGGAGGLQYQLKDTVPLKIKKEKYEGWDLDQVLKDPFDKWWKTHSYLFEGHEPKIIDSGGNFDPDFLHIRIDKTSKLEDVRDFITRTVQHQLTGKPRFEVLGSPQPDKIQNRYNALVLTYKGWSAQEICTGGAKEAIYLRATDPRSKGDRLTVSSAFDTTKGRTVTQWSGAVTKQRNGGLWHLQEVMKGNFGNTPKKGIK